MNRTKIEWADYTWTPIKGLCPEACWYCYARAIYRRFYKNMPPGKLYFPDYIELPKMPKKPSRIFVCSTMEIFHPSIPSKWRRSIFSTIALHPEHTFIILTKRPERIDRPMPPNVWLGVSLTGEESDEYGRIVYLAKAEALTKFVSFEPLFRGFDIWDLFDEFIPDWMIVGRLTGHGTQRDTPLQAIQDIVDYAGEENIPVFLKNNLKGIWPGDLIQEFPE